MTDSWQTPPDVTEDERAEAEALAAEDAELLADRPEDPTVDDITEVDDDGTPVENIDSGAGDAEQNPNAPLPGETNTEGNEIPEHDPFNESVNATGPIGGNQPDALAYADVDRTGAPAQWDSNTTASPVPTAPDGLVDASVRSDLIAHATDAQVRANLEAGRSTADTFDANPEV